VQQEGTEAAGLFLTDAGNRSRLHSMILGSRLAGAAGLR